MLTIYIDADACPVKDEVYKVARRYALKVFVVANSTMRVPADPLVELVVRAGFGAADDWIAGVIGSCDICITSDVPLAARCVTNGAVALDPKGRLFNADTIGEAVAARDLMEELRAMGQIGGGPSAMAPKDRSRFLSRLDEAIGAARRAAST
ncbi:YaiI/YqxD family protein [Gemmata sp. G18]|uniref:UPF0178 protein J8F10_24905 n=1 Tax=Gemmata palustris TaxID=2822762 RepID=A0ABS5BXM5_9BACT|nr:YaiI/YqxD family protein [Gemmata palustris]MBP3958501.1 YaiI/YqxD family protein [Gemmata palustris]